MWKRTDLRLMLDDINYVGMITTYVYCYISNLKINYNYKYVISQKNTCYNVLIFIMNDFLNHKFNKYNWKTKDKIFVSFSF